MRRIGITTTVPAEVIFATDAVAVDLNNLFISHKRPRELLEIAEKASLPKNICNWIKGIYGAIKCYKIEEVVIVYVGDCNYMHLLGELLRDEKVEVIPFRYPPTPDKDLMEAEIGRFMQYFGVDHTKVHKTKEELDRVRRTVHLLDRLTASKSITSFENHLLQVSCSDFLSNPEKLLTLTQTCIEKAQDIKEDYLRLGYVGVPPMLLGLYEYIEELGAKVIFNEMQRQFSMPSLCTEIAEQYINFTYPYQIKYRIDDILCEVRRRNIKGIIHYVQTFCYRQLESKILRSCIDLPILLIQGDSPTELDRSTRLRLEAFIDMLKRNEKRQGSETVKKSINQ